ncbi:excinuclease ABC subunit UvrA [Bifidobacterium xylocopae]|uniref:UvrABC system protein A n=1 Tax=Bifidobacterium xylocopae TaxID=2493119 RepID=A0A366KB65_9BIFI|nr:excinuclease ABC subunit UvrA [Bifidobacterium xylocopae]RBP98934.1 daunorubicin resistance protein DrrC [Bifidobacterium xylocopae]
MGVGKKRFADVVVGATQPQSVSAGAIEVRDAWQNNLRHVNLDIPKHAITVFVGLSGSGKSSLVFDTIAALSRRELNETFPSFTQQYLPKYGPPNVGRIDNLPVAIVIEQRRLSGNARSTLATYTGIYSLLRLLYSRVGKPFIGYSDSYSFNLPQGMCPRCQGLGFVEEVDESKLIDPDKSLNQGAITFVSFGPGTWRWARYANSGLFDLDKPIRNYSSEEYELLMHAPQQKLKNPPENWYKTALYEGVVPRIRRSILHKKEASKHQDAIAAVVSHQVCPECRGARLKPEALTVVVNGCNIAEVCAMDLVHVLGFLDSVTDPLAAEMVRELTVKVRSLVDIGLGYLTLGRDTGTLSGGEAQRIKIAKYLTSALSDMLYVLDEPSVGLHPHDIKLITKALRALKDKGNTILIVEHSPEVIALADHVVEIGPGAGKAGGEVVFQGTYAQLLESDTLTARCLKRPHEWPQQREPRGFFPLEHVTRNNVHDLSVDVPRGVMCVVSGVAGSGKSSLVAAFRESLAEDYVDLSQAGIGVNIRSTPATYMDILPDIRKLFGAANHVSVQLFSYNGKGACPLCKGKGVTITEMAFMDPVVQVCELCHGRRYSQQVLGYQYRGRGIYQVLSMPIDAAADFFADQPAIASKLGNMRRVGLGYLSLEQSLTTLSGGELQRLKLAFELGGRGRVYILDEPTAGLHMQDTAKLVDLFNGLVDAGNSLVIIEHNLDVISQADWLIDMGPDAGSYGGRLMYSGSPRAALAVPASKTGQALAAYRLQGKA